MRGFLERSKDILKKSGIDLLYGEDNLSWALNHDHSHEYAEAVADALEEAWKKRGKAGVQDALQEIGEILGRGEEFRGFD